MNWSTWIGWKSLNMTSSVVNVSDHHSCPFGFGEYNAIDVCIFETIIIILLTFLIIAGNLTVICVFHCAPLLHHYTTSYFIQTMAYADLFVGVSCLVPTLSLLHYSTGVHESLTCQIFGYIISVLKSVSMTCLAFISVDRYLAITKPLSYNQLVTPCRLRICIILIWLYSCLVFLPSFFGWGKPGYHGDIFEWCATSWLTNAYFTGFIVCLLYAPAAFIICFTYFHIFKICRQHTKEINERRARFPSHEVDTSAETGHTPDRRYAMVLFRITSVFYVLWLPYIIYFMLESSRVLDNPAVSFLTTWLAISNSFCNCVIYSLSNSVFRLGLWRLSETVCSSCICKKDSIAQDPVPRKQADSCSI